MGLEWKKRKVRWCLERGSCLALADLHCSYRGIFKSPVENKANKSGVALEGWRTSRFKKPDFRIASFQSHTRAHDLLQREKEAHEYDWSYCKREKLDIIVRNVQEIKPGNDPGRKREKEKLSVTAPLSCV